MTLWSRLRVLFGANYRFKLGWILVALMFGAVLEVGGIGLILPFMAIANDPTILERYPRIQQLAGMLHIDPGMDLLLTAGIGLVVFFLLKAIYLMFMYGIQNRFVYSNQAKTGRILLSQFLRSNYAWHTRQNSAELLRTITHDVYNLYHGFFGPGLGLLVEAGVFLLIGVMLLIVQPWVALATIALLGGLNASFYWAIRARLDRWGKSQQAHQADMIKWINQGLGGIKEIKISGKEEFFVDSYYRSAEQYATALYLFNTLRQTPRLVIETTIVGAVVGGVLLIHVNDENLQDWIPTASVFALAAVRLMPSLNRLAIALTSVRYYTPVFFLVTDAIHQMREVARNERTRLPIGQEASREAGRRVLKRALDLESVSYRYPGMEQDTLSGVSFTLPAGASVAFVGPSGAGKSTLMDLILGLLRPTSGAILVDGKSISELGEDWQRRIGYVPQNIYLLDTSIWRNVAFGLAEDQVDKVKLGRAIELAQLDRFIAGLPNGLDTVVGERGVRLSGGQAQRIGIARALYADPEILVFDEATSALDSDTERAINEGIAKLAGERTVLLITHRPALAEFCQRVYRIENGRVVQQK